MEDCVDLRPNTPPGGQVEAHNLLEPKAEASADLNHIILIRVLFTTAEWHIDMIAV